MRSEGEAAAGEEQAAGEDLSNSAFAEVVVDLSAREGAPVRIAVSRGTAAAELGWSSDPPTVGVNPDLLSEDVAVQRHVGAHEMGHRVRGRLLGAPVFFHGFVAAVGLTLLILAAVWVLFLDAEPPVLIGALSACLVVFTGVLALLPGLQRRQELAADAYACRHSFHFPAAAIPVLKRLESAPAWQTPFRLHPSPEARLAACRARCGDTCDTGGLPGVR